mgnify:FL=1
MKKIELPLTREIIKELKAGDNCLLTGYLYTARDAAHQRICDALKRGEPLPFDLSGQTIYYAGPTPTKPGQIIGSIGPTTSGRMDKFTPTLIKHGLLGMIGKGSRSDAVKRAIQENTAVYFGAVGGAGALISKCIKSVEVIAYDDLGCEAIRRLFVEHFPVTVINDCCGNDLYLQKKPII